MLDTEKRFSFPYALYWGLATLLIAASWSCQAFRFDFLEGFRSEYMPAEQLSKFIILLTFSVAVQGYNFSVSEPIRRLAVALLSLTIAMYFGESNFIHEWAQPFLGLVLGLYILKLLLGTNLRAFWSFVVFGLMIALGILADLIDDFHRWGYLASVSDSTLMSKVLGFAKLEEILEIFASFFLLQACSLAFDRTIERPRRSDYPGLTVIVAGLLLITVGNSILHYQYHPTILLRTAGCVLSYLGFSAVIIANRYLLGNKHTLFIGHETSFYLVSFFWWVALPTVHGDIPGFLSVLLWLPISCWLFLRVTRKRDAA